MRLLIADDEPIIRQGLLSIDWESIGITKKIEAKDGLEEIDLILKHRPHIILQDIRMTGLEGLEVVRILKERGIDSKVILLTGFGTFEYAQQAIKLGVFDYLLKPSSAHEILSTVQRALSSIKRENTNLLLEQASDQIDPLRKQLNQKTNEPIYKVLDYIDKHYDKEISLSDLADKIHFSPVYLSRLIKKETGINFTTLVNTVRTLRAAELLQSTNLKVNEVSEKVGIGNQQYFSQLFKNIYNATPTEFRKLQGESKEIKLLDFLNTKRQADVEKTGEKNCVE